MSWYKGALMQADEQDPNPRLCLPERDGLSPGAPLEIKLNGRWHRGRVELDRHGWYWTDNKVSHPLRPGQEARVWDGWTWPPVKAGRCQS